MVNLGLVNTNKLIRTYEGATGLKTGSTSLALYNLSASATRDNLSLIAVVMKAPTTKIRFSSAKTLLDYGFNTYTFQKIATAGNVVQTVDVSKGTQSSVNLVFENDSGVLTKKGDSSNVEQEIILNEEISAPISANDVLGKVNFYLDGNLIDSVNLVAESNVQKLTFTNLFCKIARRWITLLNV